MIPLRARLIVAAHRDLLGAPLRSWRVGAGPLLPMILLGILGLIGLLFSHRKAARIAEEIRQLTWRASPPRW